MRQRAGWLRWVARSGSVAAALLVAVVVAAAAGGCSGGSADTTGDIPREETDAPGDTAATGDEPPPTTEVALEAGDVRYVYEPAVGDCFDRRRLEAEQGGGRVVLVVDCGLPHTFEVFNVFQLSADDLTGAGSTTGAGAPNETQAWPGEDALARVARLRCPGPFAGWVGMPYETSTLELGWVVPDEDRWADGNRTVACTVYDPAGGRVVGTSEGSRR